MKLKVAKVALHHGYEIERPDPAVFRTYSCPICGSADHSISIAAIRARAGTSFEPRFCTLCQHRYHSRFPSPEWLLEYYRERYETSHSGDDARVRLRERLSRRLAPVKHWLHGYPDRVNDFALGVTKSDGFFERRSDIRTILEIGCGKGGSLGTFKDLHFEVCGVDATPSRVAYCRARGLDVRLVQGEDLTEVADLAPFDFVYSKHVLEHIVDVDHHIARVATIVRPGGALYIETPNLSADIVFHHAHLLQHVHAFSATSLTKLLAKQGFTVVRFLVDNNLQVLALKQPAAYVFSGSPSLDDYVSAFGPYLPLLQENASERIRLEWDHYRVRLTRLRDGMALYDAGLSPLAVKRLSFMHAMELIPVEATSLLPLEFEYTDTERAPIWAKR